MIGRVAHTHLFPGAIVRFGDEPSGAVTVEFSDGVRVGAELLGDALAVPAYTTGAGTAIPAKVWSVKARERAAGDRLLRLGTRLPG